MDRETDVKTTEIEATGDAIIIADAIGSLAEAINRLADSAIKLAESYMLDGEEPSRESEVYLDGSKRR